MRERVDTRTTLLYRRNGRHSIEPVGLFVFRTLDRRGVGGGGGDGE